MTVGGKISGERGSVLMETILVIPVYIAFFSGILMLGDLELGRNRLSAGDRMAVWLAGNRHLNKDDSAVKSAVSEKFFPKSEFPEGTKLKSFASKKNKVSFYAVVRGGAELKLVLPSWAVNSRKGVIKLLAEAGSSQNDLKRWDDISFPARKIGGKYTHSVLMRTKYDIRDKRGSVLAQGAPVWLTEYLTAYIDRNGVPNDRPGTVTATSVAQYTRYPQFEAWSR